MTVIYTLYTQIRVLWWKWKWQTALLDNLECTCKWLWPPSILTRSLVISENLIWICKFTLQPRQQINASVLLSTGETTSPRSQLIFSSNLTVEKCIPNQKSDWSQIFTCTFYKKAKTQGPLTGFFQSFQLHLMVIHSWVEIFLPNYYYTIPWSRMLFHAQYTSILAKGN